MVSKISVKCNTFLLLLALFFLGAGNVYALADLHGRITDNQTGHGIERALVTIDKIPADGSHEYAAYTDIFGFYTITRADSGDYELTASHPAYHEGILHSLSLAEDGRVEQSLILEPKQPGEPQFDVYMQVSCVVSGFVLRDVPVTLSVIPDKTDIFGGEIIREGTTDRSGFFHFRGLPAGLFSFTVNRGNNAIPGWEGYHDSVGSHLTGPHTANVQLMPELNILDVQVYGFDPVSEEDNVLLEGIYVEATGVDPYHLDDVLMPTRTGVSAITKENPEGTPTDRIWDNSRKGKVKFTGLPPIDWMIDCKRLGYEPKNRHIRTDDDAQFLYDNAGEKSIRVDMVMLDTRLSVAVDSDYRDRAMLDGKITVTIQGLKDTNTAGIEREGTVTYNSDLDRAEIEFDRILPGTYRLTAAGTAEKKIEIRAGDPENGESIENKSFDIRFTAEAFIEALPDIDREVDIHLEPRPMSLRGQLVRVDEEASTVRSSDYIHVPTAVSGITFRISDYMDDMIPEAHRVVTVDSDEKGEFTVTLLPGLYGIVVPEMDDYWGDAVETVPADGSNRDYHGWPYYQVWPFSAQSARDNFHYDVGGMAVSSDQELRAMVFIRKNWINADCALMAWDSPTASQVVAIDKSEGPGKYVKRTVSYYDLLEGHSQLTLNGPAGSQTLDVTTRMGQPYVRFERVLPGSYTVTLTHPRFVVSQRVSFDYFDFNSPGQLPATAPPPYTMDHPHPMLPFMLNIPITYKNPGSTKITVHQWVPPQTDPVVPGHYTVVNSNALPSYLQVGYAGERVFWYDGKTPSGSYAVWLDLNSYFNSGENHWYKLESDGGDLEADIYLPSPDGFPGNKDTPTAEALDIAYSLTIEARDINDPDGPAITGVSVTFNDDATRNSGNTYQNLTGTMGYDNQRVTHPNWSFAYQDTVAVNTSSGAGAPAITLTLYMERGMAIGGTITNNVTGNPVPEAGINVTKRHGGGAIFGPPSGADGTFVYPFTWNGLQTYYIEVNAKGYQTFRKRLNPEDATQDPDDARTKEHNLDIKLVPLAGPTIADADVSFDRYGSFLPSVKLAGNQSVFDGLRADEQLTLTWKLTASRRQHIYTLPQFDDPEGNARGDVTLDLRDDVEEVWLVDLRSFENNTYDDEAQPLTVPAVNEPHLVHAWLAEISRGGTIPNVFSQRIVRFSAVPEENQSQAEGRIKLWKLPPDRFQPAFVVVSRMGAVTVYPFHEKDSYVGRELTGMRLPPWMGFLSDVLGAVAGTRAAMEQVESFMPEGRFKALPRFTADIELIDDHYVDYKYSVAVNLKEGMDGPARGLVGLAPGIIGLDLKASLDAGMNGRERKFHIAVEGGISRNDVNDDGFKPSFFRHIGVDVGFDPSPYGSVRTQASESLDAKNMPSEFEITHEVSGTVGARASVSILRILQKIPYVGPVLLLAEQARAINKADAYVRGLTGLTSTTTWSTVFPHQTEHYSIVTAENRQLRRHFLGGNETGDGQTKFDICFGFGVGLEAAAIGNRVGASGDIALAGDDCGKTEEPALTIETNPLGDWPPIRRISGDVRATLNAHLDAWITRIEKEYIWRAIEINMPLGERDAALPKGSRLPLEADPLAFPKTTFSLVEMEIKIRETPRATYTPVDFTSQPPQLIQDFVPIGDFASSPIDSGMLLFTDTTTEGNLLLKAATKNADGSWDIVGTLVETAGAIVDSVVLPSEDGPIAVWSEIAEADKGNLYAPSSLRFALRDELGNWSAPHGAALLQGLGLELRLIPMGGHTGLVFLQTDQGPGASAFSIWGMIYDGDNWSEPVELAPYTNLISFDAAGTADPAIQPASVAYADGDATLMVIDWDGSQTVTEAYGPLSHPALSAETISIIFGTDNHQYLTYAGEDMGIGLLSRDAGGEWEHLGIIYEGINPGYLKTAFLADHRQPILLLVWSEGGGTTSLYYGLAAPDGMPLGRASALTKSNAGRYFLPEILTEAGQRATILVRYKNNAVEELRSFSLAYPEGLVFRDIDGDGIDDAAELPIVDADSRDDITTIYHVFPDDDFDGDGYSNAEEIRAGTDPTWAGDHPYYGDIVRDRVLNLADAIAGLRLLTGLDIAVTDINLIDVNFDGCIGIQEVLYVLQYIASTR